MRLWSRSGRPSRGKITWGSFFIHTSAEVGGGWGRDDRDEGKDPSTKRGASHHLRGSDWTLPQSREETITMSHSEQAHTEPVTPRSGPAPSKKQARPIPEKPT